MGNSKSIISKSIMINSSECDDTLINHLHTCRKLRRSILKLLTRKLHCERSLTNNKSEN